MAFLERARRRTLRPAVLWIMAIPLLWGCASPTFADAGSDALQSSATMVSESGDYIGQGTDRSFASPGSVVSVRGGSGSVEVHAEGAGGSFSFDFEAPDGKQLEVGEYTGTTRFAAKGWAGLSVQGEGRGCNTDFGRFVVKDIHVNSLGVVERFWALYEQHCEGPDAPALFGEVRVGEPPNEAPEAVPAAVDWPETAVGARSVAVPVTVSTGDAYAPIVSVALEGTDATDFTIAHDECEEPSHKSCSVAVEADPKAAGLRTAQLIATDESGAKTIIPLNVDTEPPPEPLMTSNTATLVSEPGDFIGGGENRLFDAPETLSLRGERTWVQVTAETDGEWFHFEFQAPWGKDLEVGEYTNTYTSPAATWAGFSVGGDGRGCNTSLGRFVIKDIHFNSAGQVERLWALYEQRCETSAGRVEPALFGELRVGESPTEAPEVVAPAAVDWPETAVGKRSVDVPVTVGAAETGAHVASVDLEGQDAGDFTIAYDECDGARLAPRERCDLAVAAQPKAAGLRTAQLVITDESGVKTTVPLSVDTEPPPEPLMTSNTATLFSEPGDYIGDGKDRLVDAPEAVSVNGERNVVEVRAETDGNSFSFEFAAPYGRQLEVGEYTGAKRYPFQKRAAGLSVHGEGRECNTDFGRFVIKDIHFSGSGKVERFWALYEQHCEGKRRPALFGEVRVGEPPTGAPEVVAPAAVDWPATAVRRHGVDVPVTVGAGETAAQIASVTLEGEHAADFTIVNDECEGATLSPRERCDVVLAAQPKAAGLRTAQLLITDVSGATTTVALTVDAKT